MINSGVRGVVAAMAMSGTRALTHSLGLVDRTPTGSGAAPAGPNPDGEVPGGETTRGDRIGALDLRCCCRRRVRAVARPVAPPALGGAVYGLVVLTGFEAGIAPLLGLSLARHMRPVERLVFLADHVLFGIVLAPPQHEWS